jgi:YidC/Oxa1 family membrane protein insertase
MMMWLMPGVLTVMMLFLPAALGVYMLTNSVLGISQQLAVEKLFPRVGAPVVVESEPAKPNKDDKKVVGKSPGQLKGKSS